MTQKERQELEARASYRQGSYWWMLAFLVLQVLAIYSLCSDRGWLDTYCWQAFATLSLFLSFGSYVLSRHEGGH